MNDPVNPNIYRLGDFPHETMVEMQHRFLQLVPKLNHQLISYGIVVEKDPMTDDPIVEIQHSFEGDAIVTFGFKALDVGFLLQHYTINQIMDKIRKLIPTQLRVKHAKSQKLMEMEMVYSPQFTRYFVVMGGAVNMLGHSINAFGADTNYLNIFLVYHLAKLEPYHP